MRGHEVEREHALIPSRLILDIFFRNHPRLLFWNLLSFFLHVFFGFSTWSDVNAALQFDEILQRVFFFGVFFLRKYAFLNKFLKNDNNNFFFLNFTQSTFSGEYLIFFG